MVGSNILYKIATEDVEFQQIHALNYQTFVEEIPQHPANPNRLLIDRFHAENTYIIALDSAKLVGMLAVRDTHPFSLEEKFQALTLGPLDSYLPHARRRCEVRLLSITLPYRHTACFYGLANLLSNWFQSRGCDQIVVSATTRQLKLYRHIGFVAFGPELGAGKACYQPMALTEEGCAEGSMSLDRVASARSACRFTP